MSPYPLNVATGARALHPAFRQAKNSYFCNVNGLPNCRLAVTNRGKPIAKHPAVYSPIPGKFNISLLSGGYFAEFGRRGCRRQSPAASSAPLRLSRTTTTLNQNIMTMKLCSLGRIFLFALLLPPVSPAAIAQVTEATLKLSVADEQSNTVSGVSVEITNEDTGVKRAAVTDNNGQVTVAGLPSGSYAVSLKANGFKSFSQKN